MSIRAFAGLLATAALAVGLGACHVGDTTAPCRVAVTPPALLLAPAGQGRLVALGPTTDAGCRSLGSAVRWDSQDTTVARVRADTGMTALVTGVATGNTFVIATFLADTTERAAAVVQVGSGRPGQQ